MRALRQLHLEYVPLFLLDARFRGTDEIREHRSEVYEQEGNYDVSRIHFFFLFRFLRRRKGTIRSLVEEKGKDGMDSGEASLYHSDGGECKMERA